MNLIAVFCFMDYDARMFNTHVRGISHVIIELTTTNKLEKKIRKLRNNNF